MGNCYSCKPQDTPSFGLEDEKIEKNTELGLKIYICGNLPQKQKFTDIFKKGISDPRYTQRGEFEFKTDQFYWIAKVFEGLSKQIISIISN